MKWIVYKTIYKPPNEKDLSSTSKNYLQATQRKGHEFYL